MKGAAPASAKKDVFDLIVIGSGPAGQKAALQGAKSGKRVAIIEEHPAVGGGCVHVGTLPSKSLRESIYRYSLGSRGTLGQESESRNRKVEIPQMDRLMRRRNRVVSNEAQIIFDQLKRNDIHIINGRASFIDAHQIQVVSPKGVRVLVGEFIFICVGARPITPPHLPLDGKSILDSNTILRLKNTPKSMMVLGGGIIGCEYASMFSIAGVRVTLVDKRTEMLASVDREIVSHLAQMFEHQGVQLHLGCEAVKIETTNAKGKPPKNRVHLSNGKKVDVETVLIALGRAGNTENLGLERVGIVPDERGLIKVDANFRTSQPNIYAVGDVVGAPALASTSMEQGRIACCHAFQIADHQGGLAFEMPKHFPYGIYTIPEISMIGRTEAELHAEKANFVVGRGQYRELARGQIVGDRWGLLKLLVDRKTLKLLGVHIIGDNAADLIHIGQAVMTFGGDVTYFIRNVFNYPTLAEAYKTAAFHAVNQIKGTTRSK